MLKVTQDATMLLADARSSAGAPDNFGVRFFLTDRQGEQPQVTFAFVPTPEPSDDVVNEEVVPVYVAPDLAQNVGEATLDTQEVDGSSRLVLRQ